MRLRFGDYTVDLGTRQVFRGAEVIPLSPKGFQLLELLIARRPNAVTKEELQGALWPDTFVAEANVANLVSELRTAFDDDARQSHVIRTVQRFGYAFQAQAENVPISAARATAAAECRLVWGEREIALGDGENMIGRDPAADVHLDDVSVSRYHSRIVIDGSAARLEDLGSKNGTYLRESRVEGAVPLRDGDAIRLGSVAVVFRRSEAGAPTETSARL